MTYSTSYSNNLARCLLALLAALLLSGCAFFQETPEPTATLPAPVAGLPSPQVVDSVTIDWRLEVPTVPGASYQFICGRIGEPVKYSSRLPEPHWQWQPEKPGVYRVQVARFAADGTYELSAWSQPFEIAAPLSIESLEADRSAPQAAQSVPINWRPRISGGVPPYSYQFELTSVDQQRFVQQGSQQEWQWRPEEAGRYKVRVTVIDARGNRRQSDWSSRYRIVEPLRITTPQAKTPADQYPLGGGITWQSIASGGVGRKAISFEVEKRGVAPRSVKTDGNQNWRWQPTEPGFYRVRARATDKLGNQLQSDWSGWTEVRAPLTIEALVPDFPAPQKALARPIRWQVKTSGGVGQLNYTFFLQQQKQATIVQDAGSASWRWLPREAGEYQLKVQVTDELGASAESSWSEPYQIENALDPDALIAFLPLENLSGKKIPAAEIAATYQQQLEQQGLHFLSRERLEAFMHRHRMRYTGGLSASLAEALREEEQVGAVIITSLISYADKGVPQLALSSRLVVCQELPRIAWIDALGFTGEDTPGLLALKRVTDVNTLIDRALNRLVVSLTDYLQSGRLQDEHLSDPLPPNDHYRASELLVQKPYKIAIVPFLNRYARRNAGFIVPLQLLSALHRQGELEIFEPGLVREQLLKYRLIMQAGPSLAISDVLASVSTLDADLILSGHIFDFQDDTGNPKIDFSTRLFAGKQRQVAWWSRSYASGNDGVLFYDFGRVRSAQVMLDQMTTAISELLFKPQRREPVSWAGTR
ncbi:hypothetical protein SAMN02745165_01930 [Malonomonas rubra DSM 5091]|uniref:Uncharacterized protein n=1 Tax=Malonomonas rubra DSM 5091 TaxID=1122189 RepID=A0A1M6HYQ9_MALRU|nr:hypothetical protein [Malonomonas rubra]SHJ27287.1 hypothetical protein SAMN02745165_01930 [Malonomonas rubra DSM 5091]